MRCPSCDSGHACDKSGAKTFGDAAQTSLVVVVAYIYIYISIDMRMLALSHQTCAGLPGTISWMPPSE